MARSPFLAKTHQTGCKAPAAGVVGMRLLIVRDGSDLSGGRDCRQSRQNPKSRHRYRSRLKAQRVATCITTRLMLMLISEIIPGIVVLQEPLFL